MDSIRVSNLNKKIEVNDEGEYIVLPFSDQAFPKRFFDMVESLSSMQKEIEGKSTSINDEREFVEFNSDLHQRAKEEIDKLFGADTCKKVFGDIVPGIDLIQDFLEQLMPFFEKFSKERQKELKKKFGTVEKKKV